MAKLFINISPNGPCPIFGKSKHVTIQKRNYTKPTNIVRICEAPIEDTTETSYLKFAEMAKRLGNALIFSSPKDDTVKAI
ncbi:unnamed protein product, partial [Brenthis ino]